MLEEFMGKEQLEAERDELCRRLEEIDSLLLEEKTGSFLADLAGTTWLITGDRATLVKPEGGRLKCPKARKAQPGDKIQDAVYPHGNVELPLDAGGGTFVVHGDDGETSAHFARIVLSAPAEDGGERWYRHARLTLLRTLLARGAAVGVDTAHFEGELEALEKRQAALIETHSEACALVMEAQAQHEGGEDV